MGQRNEGTGVDFRPHCVVVGTKYPRYSSSVRTGLGQESCVFSDGTSLSIPVRVPRQKENPPYRPWTGTGGKSGIWPDVGL